jgi:hypothetical protein
LEEKSLEREEEEGYHGQRSLGHDFSKTSTELFLGNTQQGHSFMTWIQRILDGSFKRISERKVLEEREDTEEEGYHGKGT